MEEFKTFLEPYQVPKGDSFTHTTKSTGSLPNGWNSASYFIAKEHAENFLTYYCNMIHSGGVSTITERPGPFGPLRVDFDFKSSLDEVGSDRQYNTEILKRIVKIYQEEIRELIDPECFNESMLWCIVLEKGKPRVEEGNLKDGFHLHFPHFVCDGWIQDFHLRDKVTSRMQSEKIWEGKSFKTPVSDFIDKNMARKQWMMYGSMNYKNNKSTPYIYNRWEKIPDKEKYGHAFNENLEEVSMHSIFEIEMEGRKNPVKYYLPRLMSIRGFKEGTTLKDEYCKRANKASKTKKRRPITKRRNVETVMEDIKTIKDGEIMSMISDDRADDYQQWRYVGWVLYNIGQGHEETLNMWIEFSRRSPKFVEGECEDMWSTFDMKDKTLSTLLYMAKRDSPNEYKKWKDTNVRHLLWKSLYEPKPTEYDIAMVVSKMFGEKFICVDAKKNQWYYFEDHRWREMDSGVQLRKLFVRDVIAQYCNLLNEINDEIKTLEFNFGMSEKDSSEAVEFKADIKKAELKKKSCRGIITALKSTTFHRKLIEMCQIEMHDPLFHKKKDENRYLMGCENGVLDLENLVFRDGIPDDYITMTTGRYYRDFHPDDEEVKELEENIRKVYTNKNRREYFYDFFANGMKGGNCGKEWLIGMGPSDGAKSSMFSLIELTFGSGNLGYTGKFGRENFVQATGRNSSSGPRPELARVRGKRFMGGQEIAKNERINLGFIKEMTGNDSFFARTLQEKGDEIRPQFSLITQLNVLPEIPGDDEAFWTRIRILDHNSKFVIPDKLCKNSCGCGKENCVYNVPDSLEEQFEKRRFHADEDFVDKMPDYADVLLWKLFDRYKEIVKTGKKVRRPREVMVSTNMHRAQNDVFKRFIDERIKKEEDEEKAKTTYITHTDIYTDFGDWYKTEYPSYKKDNIGKSTLKHELAKRLGNVEESKKELYGLNKRGRWQGYKFTDDEEIDDKDDKSFLGK